MERKLHPEDENIIISQKKLNKGCDTVMDQQEGLTRRPTAHDLPPELWMEIFTWFSVRELCLTISPVCKAWHLFSQHNFLWKHLSFEGPRVTTERLCLLLSHATKLHSLKLINRNDATAVLRQVALSNQRLQILKVNRCYGSPPERPIQEEVLLTLIKRCSNLVEIAMKGTEFNSETYLEAMANDLPGLKRINFNYIYYFDSRAFRTIACKCPPLEKVSLVWDTYLGESASNVYGNFINDSDINELCTRMQNSLKILKVDASILTDNAIKSIVQCSSLHTLRINSASRISDDGILLLTTLPHLSSLRVSSADGVSSEGWHELFTRAKCTSMRKLYFSYCDTVNDTTLETIGVNCPNLQSLNLRYCDPFTEEGLSKLIKGCKGLTFIGVCFPQSNVYNSFSLIPSYTPNLKCLLYGYVSNNHLPEAILEHGRRVFHDLQMKLPNLKLIYDILSWNQARS